MVNISTALALLASFASFRRIVGPGNIDVTPPPDKRCSLNGYGKLTRSTDECVCLTNNCVGSGCIFEQGLAFFPYSKCKDCRCIQKHSSYDYEGKKGARIPIAKHTYASHLSYGHDDAGANEADSNEQTTFADIFEYLSDLSSFIFGGAVTMFMVLLAYVSIRTTKFANTSAEAHEPDRTQRMKSR